MDKMIFNALETIFGNTLVQDVAKFLKTLIDALYNAFTNTEVSQYFTIFSAAAASLLIVFYFIDLTSNASKDMITLERLVLSFVKLMIGFSILLFLPNILEGLFSLVHTIYNEVANIKMSDMKYEGIKFWGEDTFPTKFDEDTHKFISGSFGKAFGANMAAILISMVGSIIGWVASGAAYLFAITNAVSLITRAIFSPLAVVQCFDEGQRSSGIQYLKKFAADGLTLAVMLGLLYAASLLQMSLAGSLLQSENIVNIDKESAMDLLANGKLVFSIIAINLSCIGAIMKANQLAKEIVGAH